MDFVIPWVNPDDSSWRAAFDRHRHKKGNSKSACFQDGDNVHFPFRGIQQFAPRVDKIHFVRWEHLSKWMNTAHLKLHIVDHKAFIPPDYLPTFNVRTMKLNVHHIKVLSGCYVFFNDDTFLLGPIKKKLFFKQGKPCDRAVLEVYTGTTDNDKKLFTELSIVSKNFSKCRAISDRPLNWSPIKYGMAYIKNFLLVLAKRNRTGFDKPHVPQPNLKTTLSILWEKNSVLMEYCCRQSFRIYDTVNQYVLRYWNLASNNFCPGQKMVKFFRLGNMAILEKAIKCIEHQKKKCICINDSDHIDNTDLELMKRDIQTAFTKILPDKSNFEI